MENLPRDSSQGQRIADRESAADDAFLPSTVDRMFSTSAVVLAPMKMSAEKLVLA